MKFKSIIYLALVLATISLNGCESLIEIDDPLNELPSEVIFKSETTAKSALAGAYSTMTTTSAFNVSFTQLNAMSAAEINFVASTTFQDFTTNSYDPVITTSLGSLWGEIYKVIYQFNSVIEGLTDNSAISRAVAQQLTGEAKVMRAYCYFHLINMFGDVPLVNITDVNVTNTLPRTSKDEIYQWLIAELEEAKDLVSESYPSNSGTTSRLQVNRSAAKALLARVYLYTGNYALAEKYATEVIEKTDLYSLLSKEELDKVFLKDSEEAILQLGPAVFSTYGYTIEGSTFLPTATATVANYELMDNLISAFEPGDARRTSWIKESNLLDKQTFQPYKFQNYSQTVATSSGRTEVPMVLRLAEQYLIRAEARFHTGNASGARADINMIRNRAGLADLSASAEVEDAILQERQVEFFCEQGDRWYTIKRMGKVNAIMQTLRPTTWQSYAQLYPIPQTVRDTNPYLTQNEGYR